MVDAIKKYNKIALASLIALVLVVMGLFLALKKGNSNLSEYQRRLKLYDQVQDGDEAIDGTNYVTFDAFFLEDLDDDGQADGVRGNAIDIAKNKKLWLELKVSGDVTLKNGKITFENSNVKIGGNITKSTVFKNNISSKNISSIDLSDNIGNGVSSLTPLTVEASLTNSLDSYSGTNKVIFTGTVVDNLTGEETDIRKEVTYTADWYGTTVKSTIRDDYKTSYVAVSPSSTNNAVITYNVKVNATTNMLLKSTNYEGVVGQLNGYDPVNVTVDGYNITSTYNPTTRTFIAQRASVLEDNLITTQAYDYKNEKTYWNELKITVEFPAAAAKDNETHLIDLKVFHEAYNNQGSEFEPVITSTPTTKTLVARYVPDVDDSGSPTLITTDVEVGSYSSVLHDYYVNKSNLLEMYEDGESTTTGYSRRLKVFFMNYNGTDDIQSLIIKEADYDKIENTPLNGIAPYSSIYFSDVSTYLGTSGYIKMINDDTGEVIHIFTALDWNTTYTFNTNNVYKLRFETSPLTEEAYERMQEFMADRQSPNEMMLMFTINETKKIDNSVLASMFTKEEAEDLDYVEGTAKTDYTVRYKTQYQWEEYLRKGRIIDTVTGETVERWNLCFNRSCEFVYDDDSDTSRFSLGIKTIEEEVTATFQEKTTQVGTAKYTSYLSSEVGIKLYNSNGGEINQLSTIEEKEVKIEVEAKDGYDIIKEWQDGEFLVVLPSKILDFDISDVTVTDNSVKVIGYEKLKLNGRIAIRVITENNTPAAYKININGTIKPDARTATGSYVIDVYGINPYVDPSERNTNDFYDLDNDSDTLERVNYTNMSLNLTAPNEIVTTTTLTNYNQASETSVSPEIAEVNPVVDDKDATVEIGVINSSQYSVKDIVVIGKIGYIGNTYQIGEGSLGSEYDIHMASTGITIPDALVDNVKVYYSDYETPDSDVNKAVNNWKEKEDVADWNNIKTYMIVINDYTLVQGRTISFDYDVEMPLLTSNLNKVTYFTHGVYYNVITDAGDYAANVGGSKLGVRMSRQYDLELTDTKIASDRAIPKAKYLVTDGDGETHILITNNEGKATLKDLYVGKEYTIKQISVNAPYVLDEEEKTFKIINDVDDNDNLVLQSNGEYKSINIATDKKLEVALENETRYTVVLNNEDINTNASIPYSQFKITGKGYEDGITVMTNTDGSLSLSNLYIDEVYEIEQVKVNNYLLGDKFTIKLTRDTNSDVKITYGKKVSIGEVQKPGDYGFIYDEGNHRYRPEGTYNQRTYLSYLPIDLTGLSGKYQITVPYQYYSYHTGSTFRLYLGDYISTSPVGSFVSLGQSRNSSKQEKTVNSYYSYNQSTSSYDYLEIEGGKVYYLYMSLYYKSNASTSSYYVYDPVVSLVNGDEFEYVIADSDTNVEVLENKNVRQSLQDSDNQDAPVLTVNVKNTKIPTYTLTITKKNADTKETLEGAQYKVTGPGLPESGKYITTDENGQASIELYKKMYLQDQETINGVDYRQYNSEYTIEEVVAPVGYTLDKKSVTFSGGVRLQNGQMNTNTYDYETDLSTEKANEIQYSLNTEGQFKEYAWDNDNNILNVTMYDYPLITITKKDSETNEFLPNTLFTIYEVTMVNGVQVYSPAHDANGNIVGSKATINGKEYYIIATDENGKISLNLGAGSYRIQEVQAADEKYEVSNAVYNFGVGETVPYQSADVELVDNFDPVNSSFYLGSNSSADKIKPTSDGGYIMISPNLHYVAKYDADYNIEWQVDTAIMRTGTTYYLNYEDNPTKYDYYSSPLNSVEYANDVIETSDGGFVMFSRYDLLVKLDKDGNRVWQNRDSYTTDMGMFKYVCTYEGNTNEAGQVKGYYYSSGEWVSRKNWSTGEDEYYDINPFNPNNFNGVAPRDDETYYCGYTTMYDNGSGGTTYKYIDTNFNTDGPGQLVPTNDGGMIDIVEIDNYGYIYYAKLKDESLVPIESQFAIIRYDSDGDIIGFYNLDEITKQADATYISKYHLNNTPKSMTFDYDYQNKGISIYPNGDILLLSAGYYGTGAVIKLRYNAQTDTFDTVFYTPLGINGNQFDYFYENYDGNIDLQPTSDGGFVLSWGSYNKNINKSLCSGTNEYYNTEMQYYDCNSSNSFYRDSNDGTLAILYDGEGKIKDFTILSTTNRTDYATGTFGPEDIKHIFGYIYGMFYLQQDDGSYIIGGSANGIYNYSPTNSGNGTRFVELASGEIFTIDPSATYIIYKINKDGYIDWIKQYRGIQPIYNSSSPGSTKERVNVDGKTFIVPVTVNGQVVEIGNESEPLIENTSGQTFLVFAFKDEVVAEGPEAYSLNIENKRKEYKITATSNAGGEVVVTNPDNGQTVITTDGDTTILEKVKYGDTNKYNIIVTPDTGYVVSNIRVNGEDIGYKVNDDGSILLDKISDIKENKNISITYEYGKSTVVVKHYLKDTTDSVFSDEILTGTITTPYTAEPKTSYLYGLAEENGEVILPDNMTGTFTVEPQTVIFYYVENEVDLKTNYYVDGTEVELAPTEVERKTLGSHYRTSPKSITNYNLSRTIGEEEGTLNQDVTEVTYMYREKTEATITTRYLDKDTNLPIADPDVQEVARHTNYTTSESDDIPANYRFVSKTDNFEGPAEDAEIEVIYYYEVIPFNLSITKTISSIKKDGVAQTITDASNVNISLKTTNTLVVTYQIVVENTGDIDATFKVTEGNIANFTVSDLGDFHAVTNGYELSDSVAAGATKTYTIEYTWDQTNFGTSTNNVALSDVANNLGFDEPDDDDNESTATVTTKLQLESTITTRYIDKDTGLPIADPDVQVVLRNAPYTTSESSDIPANYRFVNSVNASGNATVSEIEAIYYYEVIPFNLSISKSISSIKLNGEEQTITDATNINISPKPTDTLVVTYQIVVENTGDIDATFKVKEGDVANFTVSDLGDFQVVTNGYELSDSVAAGASKTYTIEYTWNQTDYGTSTNNVELKDVANNKGFAEPDDDDNESTATVTTTEPLKSTITTRYIDKATGTPIADPKTKVVYRNEPYTTEESDDIPANYRFESSVNASGNATASEIEAIYYYEVIPFNLSISKSISSIKLNGEEQTITDATNINISPKPTDTLVVTYQIVVENTGDIDATFKVTEGDVANFTVSDLGDFQVVTNGYELSDSVAAGASKTYTIEYTWNQTDYGTSTNNVELKDVANNKGFAEPDDDDNESTATVTTTEPLKSTITTRYIDKDTGTPIADPKTKVVYRNEPYTTEESDDIPANYRFESSVNASGNATASEIEVIYYYEVIPFNISVDKRINSVLLNGEKQTILDGKNVSISPKKEDNLIVYYEIEVKNTGEIPATFKVVEGEVPGFEIYDKGSFEKVGDNYVLNVDLQPGDSKTYKIGYKWNQEDYGISTNKVEITEVTNDKGFDEPDADDNVSTATVETKIPAKDVIPDTIIIPDTVDKIMTSIMLFIGSLVGIIVSLILIKKKRMNN